MKINPKKYSYCFILPLIFVVWSCAAAISDPLLEAEEKILNPVFNAKFKVALRAPSHDAVKIKSDLRLKFSACGNNQILLFLKDRLYIQKGLIANYDSAVIGRADRIAANKDFFSLMESDIVKVVQGQIVTEPFVFQVGRWFWMTYSFNTEGDLLCSSPQQAFFIRE